MNYAYAPAHYAPPCLVDLPSFVLDVLFHGLREWLVQRYPMPPASCLVGVVHSTELGERLHCRSARAVYRRQIRILLESTLDLMAQACDGQEHWLMLCSLHLCANVISPSFLALFIQRAVFQHSHFRAAFAFSLRASLSAAPGAMLGAWPCCKLAYTGDYITWTWALH